jgi:hypothetical protein
MDVVFVEQPVSRVPSSVNASVVTTEETAIEFSHPTMNYDELVEKIFSSEHIVVV